MNKACKGISVVIALICLLPLLLARGQVFDSDGQFMYFQVQDPSFLHVLMAHGWYLMYGLYLVINKLYLWTGLPPKFFFNALSVLSVLGLAREVYRYLRVRFGFESMPACFGAWSVLAFPAWHVAVASFFASHLFCLWMFMYAVNLCRKRPLLAVVPFLVSLNLFSLFPFAVGVACAEFAMTAKPGDWRRKALRVFLFSCALVVLYVILTSLVSVHGETGSYNRFDFRWMSLLNFAIMAAVTVAGAFVLGRGADRNRREWLVRAVLSFLALSFFAAFAYWAVARSMDYFKFGSYGSRHVLLTVVPCALLVATLARELFERWGSRAVAWGMGVLLVAFTVLLYQGYDHKVAALMFKDMLVYSLERTPAPPSGYVSIAAVGYEAPRHVHNYSINKCFYHAYGRAAWKANGFWAQRGHVYDEAELRALYDVDPHELLLLIAYETTGDAYTRYDFHLTGFHQEGRLWYWYNYLAKDYACFSPKIVKR